MDKNKKIKKARRVNFVDWMLIIIALAAVASFVYFAFFSELDLFGASHDQISVQYTIRVEKVNAEYLMLNVQEKEGPLEAHFISVGDKVYDSNVGKLIGKVSSLRYEQSTAPTGKVDENGTLVYAPYPGYVDLIITVSGSGYESSGVISIDGYEIRIGDEISFRTEKYDAAGMCTYVGGKEKGTDGN